jgi:hypothetical protein
MMPSLLRRLRCLPSLLVIGACSGDGSKNDAGVCTKRAAIGRSLYKIGEEIPASDMAPLEFRIE